MTYFRLSNLPLYLSQLRDPYESIYRLLDRRESLDRSPLEIYQNDNRLCTFSGFQNYQVTVYSGTDETTPPPPQICPSKVQPGRRQKTTFSQLRSGHSSRIYLYFHSEGRTTCPLCPDSLLEDLTVLHIFSYITAPCNSPR